MNITLQIDYAKARDVDSLAFLKKCGYDGVELRLTGDLSGADEVRRNIESCGLYVSQTELDKCNIEEGLFVSSLLGVKWAVVHPMGVINPEHSTEWVISKNVENFRRYLETAERCGVGIALENIPRFGDCPEYEFITASVDNHLEIIERIDSPKFQACWDFGHQHLNISDGDRVATLKR